MPTGGSSKTAPGASNATLNMFFTKSSQNKEEPTKSQTSNSSTKGGLATNAVPQAESSKRKSIVVISDDDEEAPPRKKQATPRKSDLSKPAPKKKSIMFSSDSEGENPSVKASPSSKRLNKKQTTSKSQATSKSKAVASSESEDEASAPKKSKASKSTVKTAKSEPISSDDEGETKAKSKSKVKSISKEKPAARKVKKETKAHPKESAKNPDPPKPKYDWAAKAKRLAAGPTAPGSKAIPDGKPNCLAGLSFVLTGELSAFSRTEAQDLIKRFGGRVTLQPSSKTNYVVLGEDAGPSKLKAIEKHGLKTLNEDELLEMIRTREGVLDENTIKKMKMEEESVHKAAKEIEKREKAAVKCGSAPDPNSQLWTSKYAPQSLREICGNKGQVEKLQKWLHEWPTYLQHHFKKPGKDGFGAYRAMLISGPPGIGKTTSAHLCAHLEGYTPIELNASDARSKKLIENAANINNTSLDGFIAGEAKTNIVGIKITNRSVLILDEVDGMSAGDRGGIGAMNALIKKSRIPIICICNDRTLQKMKPLQGTTFSLPFRRPDATMIRSRIKTISFREKLDLPANVIDQLVEGTQSDIRQILNILATWKLSHTSMNFDEGKGVIRDNEKYTVLTPFSVSAKVLGPYLFSATSRETLNDKIELYFHDMSLVPLFIQENYLKTQPSALKGLTGRELAMKQLKFLDKAASSISDGDLVDALVHSPEQHWSLLPLHAALSTVRPASFIYGMGGGYGGPNMASFPSWLGQNSKRGKLQRQLNDIQVRMRLVVTSDKPQIRQAYIPALYPRLVSPLIEKGASTIPGIIEVMDHYYLSKDDWDALVELGVGDHKEEAVLKQIPAATKTSFSKKYNASDHPIAFHKAADLGKAPKKLAGGPAPDLEEVFDVEEDIEEEKEEKPADPISKDKLLKESKPKGAGIATKSKGKAREK